MTEADCWLLRGQPMAVLSRVRGRVRRSNLHTTRVPIVFHEFDFHGPSSIGR
jgi:hypothetical protein